MESWSWRGCDGENAEVEVFARAAEVEIQINGKTAGRKKVKKCRTKFNVIYHDGEITAISYGEDGHELGRQILKTAESDTMLSIRPETKTAKQGELVFIPLQYTDSQGKWKPMEKHELKVSVENGTLEGLGSACAYVEGNYAQDTTKTYYGEAMAVIRVGKNGNAVIHVEDEKNTYSCTVMIQS